MSAEKLAKLLADIDKDSKIPAGEKEAAKDKATEIYNAQVKADETNAARTGKGTRVKVSQTRGKNPKVISFEQFDTEQTETLPVTTPEFMELTGTPATPQGQQLLVSYLIDGYNAAQYAAASDVLSEYLEPNWPDLLSKQFKQAVTNYANAAGVSLEDAVQLMKPAVQKQFEAKLAAAQG